MEKKLKSFIECIRDNLKTFAEDGTIPMDVKAYNWLWQEIHSIDHKLETDFKKVGDIKCK